MKCKNCNSNRIMKISGKTSDCFSLEYNGKSYDGYVPIHTGIGNSVDYIDMSYCLDCGTIQSDDFPISEKLIEGLFFEEDLR